MKATIKITPQTDIYNPLKYSSPLYITRANCANHIQYIQPLTYSEWMSLDTDGKAAALFVQFFDQITLAWNKVKSFYTPEEDAVSTMFQYIMKNIPLIEASEKKYTAAYMYRVAFNCLYCICHDIKRDRERFDLEVSNIVATDEGSVDLFDTVRIDDSVANDLKVLNIWKIIDSLPEEYRQYVAYILEGYLEKGLTWDRRQVLKENLKVLLAPFVDAENFEEHELRTFGDIFRHRELVNSAIVTLHNGLKVSYYNSQIERRGSAYYVTFFGPDKDYTYNVKDAEFFAVSEIEWAN